MLIYLLKIKYYLFICLTSTDTVTFCLTATPFFNCGVALYLVIHFFISKVGSVTLSYRYIKMIFLSKVFSYTLCNRHIFLSWLCYTLSNNHIFLRIVGSVTLCLTVTHLLSEWVLLHPADSASLQFRLISVNSVHFRRSATPHINRNHGDRLVKRPGLRVPSSGQEEVDGGADPAFWCQENVLGARWEGGVP